MESDIVKAIILGVVQGLTEFFPVSSTAHLILFPWFFGWGGEVDTLTFDVSLHGGTLCALLICFYKDWIGFLRSDRNMLLLIALASVPAGLAGVLFKDVVENALRSPLVIVVSLISVGVIMLFAERYSRTRTTRLKRNASLADAVTIGAAQAVALIPGVSRSGITITAGLFRTMTRESAARFSFLLSTPVIAGATLLHGRQFLVHQEYHLGVFAAGFAAALVSGIWAIKFLMRFLRSHPMNVFVYYRFLLAAVIIVAWLRTGMPA
ncbi:MAG: undecaprenyl-diphosphate phosphatase [Chloroflexota bacterium]